MMGAGHYSRPPDDRQTFPSHERVRNVGIKYGRVKERPGAAVPQKYESKEVWTQPDHSFSETPRRL
jgi:hypothetical protein